MAPRTLPVTRIAAALAVVVGILVIARGAGGPRWRTLRPGAEFTTFRGDVWGKSGPGEVVAIRLDPARVRLRVRHFSLLPERRPLNIVEWQRRTGALAVFNAGQYYEDFSYMGLLVCDGRVVSGALHPGYKAALVAAPDSGAATARVLDLTLEPLDPAHPGWREVAQSFMLFDRSGTLRIRKSDRIAAPPRIACPRCRYLIYDYPRPAAGMLVLKGDAVLVLRRGAAPKRGFLDIPGGFVDANEDLEAAARRELREETGLAVGR